MIEKEIRFYDGQKTFYEKTQRNTLHHTRRESIRVANDGVIYPELAFDSSTNTLFLDSTNEVVTAFGLVNRIYVN